MDKEKYRPGLPLLLIVFLVIGQIISMNYLKNDFENKIQQCYEAINTNSLLNSALINILAEKKILEKNDVLQEAQKLSVDLKDMIDKMKTQQKKDKESAGMSDNKS